MIHRNNPWQVLNEINNLFDPALRSKDDSNVETSRWLPAVDISEDAEKFILTVDVPGVDPNDVEISMENNVLTVKGARDENTHEEKPHFHRVERMKGSFYRRFTLPDTADSEQVKAKARNGVLEVIIGKRKASQLRKISIDIQD